MSKAKYQTHEVTPNGQTGSGKSCPDAVSWISHPDQNQNSVFLMLCPLVNWDKLRQLAASLSGVLKYQ